MGLCSIFDVKKENIRYVKNKPIIRMAGVGKEFRGGQGNVRALEDINLEIMQGEVFGIIGLSGAGKSTLVRCISY